MGTALLCACVPGADQPDQAVRQVVYTRLPLDGVGAGRNDAPVTLIEFGSYTCPLCLKFATEVFPRLESEFVGPGLLKYRYVDMSPPGGPARISAMAECLAPSLGFADARRWVYSTVSFPNFETIVDSAAHVLGRPPDVLLACIDSVVGSARRRAERDAALKLSVRGTPTFILGELDGDGRAVGWAFVGLQSADTLARYVLQAARLLK